MMDDTLTDYYTDDIVYCEVCGSGMVKRNGKFGLFLACPKSNKSNNHGTITIYEEAPEYTEATYKSLISNFKHKKDTILPETKIRNLPCWGDKKHEKDYTQLLVDLL